jgi:hypothetical protein
MAKATLDQAVARVDMEFDVFWKRKKCRLASSVAYPPVMVWLSRAAATNRISCGGGSAFDQSLFPNTRQTHP